MGVMFRSMKLLIAALAVLCVSCGGEEECAKPSGTYVATAVYRDGTCGPGWTTIADSTTPAASNCKSTVSSDPATCIRTVVTTCNESAGIVTTGTFAVRFSNNGNSGNGVAALGINDPSGVLSCNGSYDVTYSRP